MLITKPSFFDGLSQDAEDWMHTTKDFATFNQMEYIFALDMLLRVTLTNSDKNRFTWDKYISNIEFSINSTYQSAIKRSPFEVLYRRKVLLHRFSRNEPAKQEQVVNDAKVELKRVAEEMRKYESNTRCHRQFAIGKNVLVKKEPHNIYKNINRYEGPYPTIKF